MIDIKFLRENPEIVKENIRKKFQDSKLPMVDEVIALDADRRKAQQEADREKTGRTGRKSDKYHDGHPEYYRHFSPCGQG